MIAIRGAVRVARNDRESIHRETRRLLEAILERNGLPRERVVSAVFTMTPDLNADFPAYAARSMGWTDVPMLGAQETPVPGALDRMVRVLLHADAAGPARHVYLDEAAAMRPDLAETRPSRAAGDAPAAGEEPSPAADAAAPATASPSARAPSIGPRFGPILVCGLGLIGGSLAMVLRRGGRFAEVLGQDPDPRALELARAAGAVTTAAEDPDPFLRRAETVVLAMPVGEILAWLGSRGPNLRRGTVVLDVGSTKAAIVGAMDGLPEGVEAIGTHPMAGSERGGMAAARPDLFHDAPWALVETGRTGARARAVATAVVEGAGARALFVGAEEHDRAVAVTSHLPYLLACALALEAMDDGDGVEARALAGPGLRDMTRLAASDPRLMAAILATNRENVGRALDAFGGRLAALADRLEAKPETAGADASYRVPAALAAARAARESFYGG